MYEDNNWIVFTIDGAVEFVTLDEALDFIKFWEGHCVLASIAQPPEDLVSMVTAVMLAYMQDEQSEN